MWFRALVATAICLTATGCLRSQSQPAPPAVGSPTATSTSGRSTVLGQAPAGSVVMLEEARPQLPGPGSESVPGPAGPAILDQYGRNFVPDVLIVRVGQRVEFRNSEDIDHNVTVIRSPTGTKVFDTSTSPYQKYEHTFGAAGRYEVSCDVHPGMRATIVATTAPHSVVIDPSGRFTFAEVEPGSYKLTVSGTRTLERTIDVSGPRVDLGAIVR